MAANNTRLPSSLNILTIYKVCCGYHNCVSIFGFVVSYIQNIHWSDALTLISHLEKVWMAYMVRSIVSFV